MRNLLLAIGFLFLTSAVNGQRAYWQQEVNYTIDVSLNDKTHALDAFEQIEYINRSPDTLFFIWFHLWPNAYKNDKTQFSDQLLENGITRFYFSGEEEKGYINRLDFKVNSVTASVEDHPQHIDIIKLILPSPLAPGQTAIITTPFHVKLPHNVSRGGHDGQSYQATQWFPKPAVYDNSGWHPMTYLDQGEFYGEFGNFDVSITVPDNYVVAATGELQNPQEKEWLKTRASYHWKPVYQKVKTKGGGFKKIVNRFPPSSNRKKTVQFRQEKVHDFAWFADKRFIVQLDSCRLFSGRLITVFNYYYEDDPHHLLERGVELIKSTARFYSNELGDYPYPTLSVVQGPESFGGGMEYPTIAVISPIKDSATLKTTIVHEIGHNWFYGLLATNERDHPWMDEGINTFYENKFKHGHDILPLKWEGSLFRHYAQEGVDQPISTNSESFNAQNYNLVAYDKAADWMRLLESAIGPDTFRTAMQEYYRRWQFKHPQPQDFREIIETTSRKNLDSIFSLLNQKGLLPTQELKGSRILNPLSRRSHEISKISQKKNIFVFSPIAGFNGYDKLMIGLFATNMRLPTPKLQFAVAPMYALNSKRLTGIGFMNYNIHPKSVFQRIDVNMTASKFTVNEFKRTDGKKFYFGFEKYAPSIRFTFRNQNPRSEARTFVEWRTYFIKEQDYRVSNDSIFNPPDTIITQKVNTVTADRTLHQLKIVSENTRILYPYRGELKLEQGNDFVRLAFTGNYFFNYASKGGLSVRFFAGKFFYTTEKTFIKEFETDRYQLNLTGANGYEDYTYSDYFIGRNKFEGLASQQIMVRDGGFKIRTDLLQDKIGKTDDWLIAANFTSDIPLGWNNKKERIPFLKLRLFADVGTVAESWDRNSNQDRFLFDAGVQLSTFFDIVNLYVPLVYSGVFKDYVQSYLPKGDRFGKKISFSIDISNLTFKKLSRQLAF